MRVGFGCTVLAQGLCRGGVDGIGSYTRELGCRLSASEDIELLPVTFNASAGKEFPFSAKMLCRLPRYAPMAGFSAVSSLSFPKGDAGGAMDLFHATDHLIPKFSDIPVVATLMDAIPLSHPEWVRARFLGAKRWLWRRAAQWADHVLTISEYSKQEIARCFGIAHEKISVIPLGVDDRYIERFLLDEKREILRRLDLPARFFLTVGTLQPRKNVGRIIEAHAALPTSLQKEIPLVIVGRNGWGCEMLVSRLNDEDARGRVHWLKYLPDREVRLLMQTAEALVFPSLHEGFGLPVVEAFASGLPVITSNTTALPEVAQNAALLVDPLDTGQICDAMRQIAEDSGLARKLVSAGESRARALSWSTCADRTAEIYRKVLQGR